MGTKKAIVYLNLTTKAVLFPCGRTVVIPVEKSSTTYTIAVGVAVVVSVKNSFEKVTVTVEIAIIKTVTVKELRSVITVGKYPPTSGAAMGSFVLASWDISAVVGFSVLIAIIIPSVLRTVSAGMYLYRGRCYMTVVWYMCMVCLYAFEFLFGFERTFFRMMRCVIAVEFVNINFFDRLIIAFCLKCLQRKEQYNRGKEIFVCEFHGKSFIV